MEDNYQDQIKKNYFQLRIKINIYILLPVLIYIIYITYIIHNSRGFAYIKRKVNKKTLSLKKKLTVTMSVYFIYQALFAIKMEKYLDDNEELLTLLIEFLKFASAVLTPFVIIEQSKKEIPFYLTRLILIYWVTIMLVILYEMYIEIKQGLFFGLLTFSSIGLVASGWLSYVLFKYPRDELIYKGNRLLAELQLLTMISENTINQNKKEFKEVKFKGIHKIDFDSSDAIPKRKSEANVVTCFKNEMCLDEIYENQPEKLPHYPKIEIKIKNDYKYLKNNTNDESNVHKNSLILNNNNFNAESLSFISNFYFQIIVVIKDKHLNQMIKRSIKDFFVLDEYIKMEFDQDKYIKKLIDRLPRLKIPIKNYNNSLDFFKNYKINFEMYLKNILNEPSFITNDVLEFLNIYDNHMAFSYDLARKNNQIIDFYRIKDDIIAVNKRKSTDLDTSEDEELIRQSVSRLKQDLSMPLFYPRHSRENSNTITNTNKLSHHMSYTATNTFGHASPRVTKVSSRTAPMLNNKIDILEITRDVDGEYTISIRFSHVNMFKIMKKKLSEVIKMVNELFYINKNNENIKNLIKIVNSQNFLVCSNFTNLLENVLQNSYDNLKLYKSNPVINDFFMDFVDSNYVSRGESFLLDPKNSSDKFSEVKEDPILNKCKNLIQKFDLNKVTATIPNYFVLSHNFKPNYFYILNVQLELGNGRKEKIVRKFKYKELRQYIDFMSVKMNLRLNTKVSNDKLYRNIDDKIQKRITEITESLEEIFAHPNLKMFPEWLELFNRDDNYKNIISNQQSSKNAIPKPPSLIIRRRTESKDSLFNIHIRESIL